MVEIRYTLMAEFKNILKSSIYREPNRINFSDRTLDKKC